VKPERVVLVLSGGGMKAMSHLGALRALDEAGLYPAEIVASSAGALVGALIAGGMPYDRMVELVCSLRREDLFVPNRAALLLRGLGAGSVVGERPVRAFLQRSLPVNDFARLRLPLRITAVDLDRGELVVFGSAGRTDCTVAEAVYASMALPLYLPPAVIGGRRYGDGGLLQVLPLDVAAEVPADLVVACDVGPVSVGPPEWARRSPALLAAHDRALAIALADQRARVVASWQADPRRPPLVLVEPPVDPHATYDFDRTADSIEAGYRAAHAAIAGVRATGGA
jgi:NTE family protein